MVRLARGLLDLLSSVGLTCVLLLLLFLLTYLGTLHQVDNGLYLAQKTYFDSLWLRQPIAAGLAVPLPGGLTVMALLFVNLVLGGIARARWEWRKAGILITHLGIALILVAGFVKFYFSDEGSMLLYEGERASEYQSYHEWEIVVGEPLADGRVREHLIAEEQFAGLTGHRSATFAPAGLPFVVEVGHHMANCRPMPKGPMFEVDVPVIDGFFLESRPLITEASRNVAGCYVTCRRPDGGVVAQGIVWGGERAPLVVDAAALGGGRGTWTVGLRKKRMSVPFTVALDRTARELHPGTTKPKAYMSDVTVIDAGVAQPVRIQMNEPLRRADFVLYQSGWGPDDPGPDDRLFSIFAVVRNPADRWPLYSCIVIAVGLLLHFSLMLTRYIGDELGSTS